MFSSTVQQLASRVWHWVSRQEVTVWRGRGGWEMVELKDHQQQEMQGKLHFHAWRCWNAWSHLWKFATWQFVGRGLIIYVNPKLLIYPSPVFPLCSNIVWVCFYFVSKFMWIFFFRISHVSDMIFVFDLLHLVWSSIQVAANGIISSLLWLSNIPLCHAFIHASAGGHRLFPCLGYCK